MAQSTTAKLSGISGSGSSAKKATLPSAPEAQPQRITTLVFTSFLFLVSLYVWAALLSFSIADWPGSLFGQYPDILVAPAPETTHNLCGRSGAWVAYMLLYYFGAGAYILAGFLSFVVMGRAFRGPLGQPWFRGIGVLLMMTAVAASLAPGQPLDQLLAAMSSEAMRSNRLLIGNGGILGMFTALFLTDHFGTYGWMIMTAGFVVGVLLAFDDLLARTPAAMHWVRERVGHTAQAIQEMQHSTPFSAGVENPALATVTLGAGQLSLASAPPSARGKDLWKRVSSFFLGKLPETETKTTTPEPSDKILTDTFPENSADQPTADISGLLDEVEKSDSAIEKEIQKDQPAPAVPLVIERPRPTRTKPSIAPPVLESDLDSEMAKPGKVMEEPEVSETPEAKVEKPKVKSSSNKAKSSDKSEKLDVEAKVAEPEVKEKEADEVKTTPEARDEPAPVEAKKEEEKKDAAETVETEAHPKPKVRPELIVRMAAKRPKPLPELVRQDLGDYKLPPLTLLEDPDGSYSAAQESIIRQKGQILQDTLNTFRIDARVVRADTGPVITMFEVEPAAGVKVSQISSLANDIARAMSALTIRIVAPIPGKNTVGIEVPNANKEKVRLKELFQMMPDAPAVMNIPVYLGKDASGNALVTDLTKWPHGLVAGTTGSGKSVCINTIVMSVLLTQRPDTVKLIMVDPKMVELSVYKDVPHLLSPIITDMTKAAGVFDWAVNKMEERYALLAEAGVRDLRSYNKLGPEKLKEIFQPSSPEEEAKIPLKLPYIVVIIDEFADLMLTNGKEIENYVVRLAQKSRAVGIHLILATQRPDANVVTGLIKSNMPTRVAFRVAGRNNSRIVLDQNGAEVLLGQGDMLFLPPGGTKLMRAQGTYIEDSELHGVLNDLKGKAKPEFSPELLGLKDPSSMEDLGERDELFDQAVRVVLETKRGSVSLIQRKFGVGYGRASRIIDQMAEAGILGSHKNAQAREVCMTVEEYEAICAQAKADADAGYAADQEAGGDDTSALANETEAQREARESRERQEASADEDDDGVPDELSGEERG